MTKGRKSNKHENCINKRKNFYSFVFFVNQILCSTKIHSHSNNEFNFPNSKLHEEIFATQKKSRKIVKIRKIPCCWCGEICFDFCTFFAIGKIFTMMERIVCKSQENFPIFPINKIFHFTIFHSFGLWKGKKNFFDDPSTQQPINNFPNFPIAYFSQKKNFPSSNFSHNFPIATGKWNAFQQQKSKNFISSLEIF